MEFKNNSQNPEEENRKSEILCSPNYIISFKDNNFESQENQPEKVRSEPQSDREEIKIKEQFNNAQHGNNEIPLQIESNENIENINSKKIELSDNSGNNIETNVNVLNYINGINDINNENFENELSDINKNPNNIQNINSFNNINKNCEIIEREENDFQSNEIDLNNFCPEEYINNYKKYKNKNTIHDNEHYNQIKDHNLNSKEDTKKKKKMLSYLDIKHSLSGNFYGNKVSKGKNLINPPNEIIKKIYNDYEIKRIDYNLNFNNIINHKNNNEKNIINDNANIFGNEEQKNDKNYNDININNIDSINNIIKNNIEDINSLEMSPKLAENKNLTTLEKLKKDLSSFNYQAYDKFNTRNQNCLNRLSKIKDTLSKIKNFKYKNNENINNNTQLKQNDDDFNNKKQVNVNDYLTEKPDNSNRNNNNNNNKYIQFMNKQYESNYFSYNNIKNINNIGNFFNINLPRKYKQKKISPLNFSKFNRKNNNYNTEFNSKRINNYKFKDKFYKKALDKFDKSLNNQNNLLIGHGFNKNLSYKNLEFNSLNHKYNNYNNNKYCLSNKNFKNEPNPYYQKSKKEDSKILSVLPANNIFK